jgi:multidrug efflux pump subunit AcrB
VAETTLIGGSRRTVRVLLDPVKLASRNLSPAGLVPMLQQANRQFRAGGLTTGNNEVLVETGAFLKTAHEVGDVVIGVFSGRPVYLREVAEIADTGEEPTQYVLPRQQEQRRTRRDAQHRQTPRRERDQRGR